MKLGRGDGKRADRVEAEVGVVQVTVAAEISSIQIDLVSGIDADLNGRMVCATQCGEVAVTANPDLLMVVVRLPLGIGLPAGFVEMRRGPGGIVAGAPDALACRDINNGLGGEG